MESVFKVVTDPAPAAPAVKDTTFRLHYEGVNHSMAWADLSPSVRKATELYILDYLGEPFIDALLTDASLSDHQTRAIQLLRDAVAHYAIYLVLPVRNNAVSSLGVMQNTPDGGSTPTPQWAWKASRWAALEGGDTFLDRLLKHLEARVKANDADFDTWKDSDAYKRKTCDFFRHTEELDEYLNIQMSRRSFISLVRYMREVETDVILPLLCDTTYTNLKSASPSDANKKLLPMVKRAVAYLGAALAIPHHRVVIDGDGFRIVSQTDQFDDRRNLTNNTHQSAIESLLARCEDQGNKAVTALRKFLEDNINDYPDYRDSTCRVVPDSKAHGIEISDGGSVVGLF